MMPVYRYMDSNPHQRNQAPFPQHYCPGFEAVPPHFKVDPSKSPMTYECWPCSNTCGRYPVPYHGGCNHGDIPGYYSFIPPYPHFAPPSPAFHPYPNYPPFAEAFPVYYAPPPHYSNEQPRYEYDKDAHTNYHCCGCPNHLSYQKSDRSLKIEQQVPEAEKKEGDSVVPVQPRSYPYPIVWIPPEYLKNNEYRNRDNQVEVSGGDKAPRVAKPREQEPNSYPIVWIPPEYMESKDHGKRNDQSEVIDSDKAPLLVKTSKSSRPSEHQQPRVWNGWFPLDIDGLKSLMQGEGEKNSQNQQNEDKMSQFPFPVFWVPSDAKQEEGENQDKLRMIAASDHSKQAPGNFKLIPVEPSVKVVKIDKPQSEKEISQNKNASETRGETTANQVSVPIEDKEGKSERTEKRGRDVSVKHIEDTAKDELGTIGKRKSLSPPKASRLPPVCLRIDPLPKKRNGNGSPRSPSPSKEQPQDTVTKAYTPPSSKEDLNAQSNNGGLDKVEPGERKTKDIQVIEERSKESKAGESTNASQDQVLGDLPLNSQELSGKSTVERAEKDSHDSKTEEETKASIEEIVGAEKEADNAKATNPDEPAQSQCKAEIKRKMSEAEAAKLIQSAFRGFEVRKWEPLKKLKQIAKLREQVVEIRNLIQSLESSSNRAKDDRQRLLTGEKIMTLLLKLDTVQGLHPSVRDSRKSLVRELVALQEKLDSLTGKCAEEKAKELVPAESVDCSSDQACRNVSTEMDSKNASAAFQDTNENRNNIKEPDQEYLTRMEDGNNGKDEETTEPPIVEKDLDGKIENGSTELRIEDGDVLANLEHMTHKPSVPEQKSDTDEFVGGNDLTREEKPEMVEVNDLILVDSKSEDGKLRSLPKADHTDAVCELEKEIGNNNGEEESYLPINPSLADEVENLRCAKKEQEIDLLKELPVGIIGEEPAISEIEKRGMHETGEINTLSEVCFAASKLEEQLLEAAPNTSVKDQRENEFTNNPELEVDVEQQVVNNDNKTLSEDCLAGSKLEEQLLEAASNNSLKDQAKYEVTDNPELEVEQKEVNNDNKFESFFKPEGLEVPLTVDEENNGKLQQPEDDSEAVPADHLTSSESEAGSDAIQEKEVLFEEKKEADQPVRTEEKEEVKLENEMEVQEGECMNDELKINMPRETAEESTFIEKDAPTESNLEQDILPASPAATQMLEPNLAKIGGDNNLIEENKKLKEIMEKLMEAGKDQLTVISNLTERVKDLEEKLLKNKKSSKPRYRKVKYVPSYPKAVRGRGKATEVAI